MSSGQAVFIVDFSNKGLSLSVPHKNFHHFSDLFFVVPLVYGIHGSVNYGREEKSQRTKIIRNNCYCAQTELRNKKDSFCLSIDYRVNGKTVPGKSHLIYLALILLTFVQITAQCTLYQQRYFCSLVPSPPQAAQVERTGHPPSHCHTCSCVAFLLSTFTFYHSMFRNVMKKYNIQCFSER